MSILREIELLIETARKRRRTDLETRLLEVRDIARREETRHLHRLALNANDNSAAGPELHPETLSPDLLAHDDRDRGQVRAPLPEKDAR